MAAELMAFEHGNMLSSSFGNNWIGEVGEIVHRYMELDIIN